MKGCCRWQAEGGTAYPKAPGEASAAQGRGTLGQPLGHQSLEVTQRAVGVSKCASYECTQQEVLWPLHSVYKPFPKGTMTSPTRGESPLLPTLTQDSYKDLWGFEQHPEG